MLYEDYKIKLPFEMPKEYTLRLQPYKNGAESTAVLHTGPSKRDSVTHKLIHAKRITIGKVVETEGESFLVPNEKYFELFNQGQLPPTLSKVTGRGRPIKEVKSGNAVNGQLLSFGYALAWLHEAKELGLYKILVTVFGTELAMQMLTIAAFYAFDKERGLTLLEKFAQTQMNFCSKPLNSQRACELFSAIEETELKAFFEQWIELTCGKEYCFYDVTSVSYTGDSIVEVAWGYNRDHEDLMQINLGLFVSQATGLPLFYCSYNGGLNDFTNFPYVMSEAKFMGLAGGITIVGDRIFSDLNCASRVYKLGYGLLVGLKLAHNHEAKNKILSWRKNPNHKEEIGQSPTDGMVSSVCSFTLKDVPGRLFMYKQDDTAALQWSTIRADVKDISNLIATKQGILSKCPPAKIKRLCEVQPLRDPAGITKYRISLSNDKIQDLMDLCGCFAIFTTDEHIDPFNALKLYRAKDICEKNFANLKNELIGERMMVHSSKAWHGKLFILFLSLIVRTSLFNKLKPWIVSNRSSLRYTFVELSQIRCRKNGERWLLKDAITKKQQELATLLGLPLDYLRNSILP